jgi:enamine deaminase RidA (YjgF/YER057c/UK114 family)
MLTNTNFLKVGPSGDLRQHRDCAEHITAVFERTGMRAEIHVVPDGWNTCLRIEVFVDSVEQFHMLIGGLTDWASAHYGRAVLEITN